jgi:hypothetical protein
MPSDTIVLVDEFHEIFFNQSATVVNGKLISGVLKLKASAQLIGVSATYRGDTGIKKISTIMNAHFLKSPAKIQERKLELDIFGKVLTADIPTKVVQLALEKAK